MRNITDALARDKSVLLFGARQTGKTTLIDQIEADVKISFIQPAIRQLYEKNPSLLGGKIEALKQNASNSNNHNHNNYLPLVIIDEVQKVPEVLDVVQDLIDRKIAKFILTGSSARKLKRNSKLNLLPGRVVVLTLTPLTLTELLALPSENRALENLLLFGALPGIVKLESNDDRNIDLHSYVTTYLEEEIRAEAAVRNVASFAKFLTLAASEAGNLINFNKLSQEIGVAHTTIAAYYQILEDCLVAERIEPFTQTIRSRRRLVKTPKYLLFDLGIRRLAADEGYNFPREHWGRLFEQFVGLELLRLSQLNYEQSKIYFWHDHNGPEVDWIIARDNQLIPIEVKWTDQPTIGDAKHLQVFCDEYDNTQNAYVVCRVPWKLKLADRIFALPWQEIDAL